MQRTNHKFDIIIPPQEVSGESDLKNKFIAGDKDAFAWVYKNYCKKVYNYAFLITSDEAMSEDIVQDVFIKLWREKEKLLNVHFDSYFYILYRNHILDVLRKEKRRKRNNVGWASLVDTIANDDVFVMSFETKQQSVFVALQEVPEVPRKIIDLRLQGKRNPQIAKLLNKNPVTVRKQFYLGVKILKAKIKNQVRLLSGPISEPE